MKTKKIAEKVLETTGKKECKNYWFTQEIKNEIQKKKTVYLKWMSSKSVEDRNIYAMIKRNLNHIIRSIKIEYLDRKCVEINSYLGYKRSTEV